MNPEFVAISIVILLFSVILHEVMHGWVALMFGDDTAEKMGRLTLNPIPHIDPIGTILLPLFFIMLHGPVLGWAKPVPVNPLKFNDTRRGELFVSLAGVLSNFALALIGAIGYHLATNFFPNEFWMAAFRFTVYINLSLGIFNLLPIPPLDGSKVVMSQLPFEAARAFDKYSQFGSLILIALVYLGVIGPILSAVLTPLLAILGIPEI